MPLRSRVIASVLWVVVPVVCSLFIWVQYEEGDKSVTVTVVQPNIDPYTEKFKKEWWEQNAILTNLALTAPRNVDFIVMPETALSMRMWEHNLKVSSVLENLTGKIFEKYPDVEVVVGATTHKRYGHDDKTETARVFNEDFFYDIYNSAIVLDSAGFSDIHHKSKLVVGVEKMPFRNLTKYLDFLIVDLGGATGQLGVDPTPKVFESRGGISYATAICYESVYGAYFSSFAKGGAQMMFVITNDGWWEDTPGYRQHFSYARLRAIETRRSIARSANTGISGFINQKGQVISQTRWDERKSLTEKVRLNSDLSFYTIYGDYIARISVYVLLLSLLYLIRLVYLAKYQQAKSAAI